MVSFVRRRRNSLRLNTRAEGGCAALGGSIGSLDENTASSLIESRPRWGGRLGDAEMERDLEYSQYKGVP